MSARFYCSTIIIGVVLETFQFIRLGIFEVVLFLHAEKKVGHTKETVSLYFMLRIQQLC
jgi:hypothetical protein